MLGSKYNQRQQWKETLQPSQVNLADLEDGGHGSPYISRLLVDGHSAKLDSCDTTNRQIDLLPLAQGKTGNQSWEPC